MSVGERFGKRVVTAIEVGSIARWRCDCGSEGKTHCVNLRRAPACKWCHSGAKKPDGPPATELASLLREARLRCPEVWVGPADGGDDVRLEAVIELIDVVGPMMLSEIGELFGISREGVRQIEEKALRKIRRRRKLETWRK